MISTMTFDDLVGHYENCLAAVTPEAADEAQARLANWLDDGASSVISRRVRIVLVSAGAPGRRGGCLGWADGVDHAFAVCLYVAWGGVGSGDCGDTGRVA